MDAARSYRTMVVDEDADESATLYVPDGYDALDDALPMEATWPEWTCDCGTHNDGDDLNCAYCGDWREDVDQCG